MSIDIKWILIAPTYCFIISRIHMDQIYNISSYQRLCQDELTRIDLNVVH